jgi:predicted nucleic acid-binding protein
MILLDSDVLIDLLRKYPPAMAWFDTLQEDEELMVSGYVFMELIQGCRNKVARQRATRACPVWGGMALSDRL